MNNSIPVYAAAILLDPSCRGAYLKKNWPAEWYEPAIEAANTLWLNEFKDDTSSVKSKIVCWFVNGYQSGCGFSCLFTVLLGHL
jgi:hypothetical protein